MHRKRVVATALAVILLSGGAWSFAADKAESA